MDIAQLDKRARERKKRELAIFGSASPKRRLWSSEICGIIFL